MEIAEIYYKAKDGRIFTDPLKCEEYEAKLGIIGGSVGELINELEKHAKPEAYVNGMVMVRKADGTGSMYTRCTVCIDDMLEDYVNVENLSKEQRYESATVGGLLSELKEVDKDLPCQYFLIWSKNIDMEGFGIVANYNKKAWNKDKKE